MTRHRPYRPQALQILADTICADMYDMRKFMNPLTGILPVRRTIFGYRYLSPDGGINPIRGTTVIHRAVVPPGHGGRGGTLSYRALAPAGAARSLNHCTLYIR